MLSPELGQRVLEVGPGTGYYALEAARWRSVLKGGAAARLTSEGLKG
jgi:precorrin-6B methylase 2